MTEQKQKTIDQFDKWADGYEKGLWGHYFLKSGIYICDLLKQFLPHNADLLDIGCGTGTLVGMIAEYFNGNIIGIDISPEMIKCATEKNKNKKVSFINADVENLSLQFQQFDAIICMNSFHHYSDHKCVVSKISYHLKDGGVFILLDPIKDNLLRKLWTQLLITGFKEKGVIYFSKKVLNDMMKKEGFFIKHQELYMYFALISIFEKASKDKIQYFT